MEILDLTNLFNSIRDDIPRNTWIEVNNTEEARIKEEIDFVINTPGKLNNITTILFKQKEKTSDNIYDSLEKIVAFLGFHDYANKLAGNVFFEILNSFSPKEVENVLNELLDKSNRNIWGVIHSLPFLFSRYKLAPTYAANWFFQVGENIREDLASGDFFNAVDNYAYNFPEEGLNIYNIYSNQKFGGLREVLSAILLGSIRSVIRNKKLSINISTIENELKYSPDENYRYIFYKSWAVTYFRDAASYMELMEIVNQAIKGKAKEVSEAFFIVFRIIVRDINNEKIILPTLDWLNNNITNKLPSEAIFQVNSTLYWLVTFDKNIQNIEIRKERYLSIISKTLPIDTTFLGSWRKIEEILTSLINRGKKEIFKEFFNLIINKSTNQFLELFLNDHFKSLEYSLGGELANSLFTQLIFSAKQKDIKTAIEIFKKIKDVSIINPARKPTEQILSRILMEFSRNVLLAKGTSDFLLLIEPFFRSVKKDLKAEFTNEMIFQAVNYRGACFDEWSKIENPSSILKEVVEKARNYYSKLGKVSDLPARNFTYYRFEEGAELERKMQSRDLNKRVQEKSVFLSLIRHTQILYGDSWAVQDQVTAGQANKFNEISYSVEFPRIENIDPEGMVLKRMFINSNIKRK